MGIRTQIMTFVIYYFDAKQQVGSASYTGSFEEAEVVAGAGIISHRAIRATINDPLTGKVLKDVNKP